MEFSISWNITALSFSLSSVLSALVAFRAFIVWRKQAVNPISAAFFGVLLFLFLYVSVRAVASLLFAHDVSVLAQAYVFSHLFLGIATAYMVRFSIISFFREETARRLFFLTLFLFALDIVLNLFYPNSPVLHEDTGIIHWGTQLPVAIVHTGLLWGAFLLTASLFLVKGLQYKESLLRKRSLLIAASLFAAILIVIPRNIVESPIMIFISDVGFIIAFLLVFLSISLKPAETKERL